MIKNSIIARPIKMMNAVLMINDEVLSRENCFFGKCNIFAMACAPNVRLSSWPPFECHLISLTAAAQLLLYLGESKCPASADSGFTAIRKMGRLA
jgi:hypothetical protein